MKQFVSMQWQLQQVKLNQTLEERREEKSSYFLVTKVRDWRNNQHAVSYDKNNRSQEISNSYKRKYREHLERSLEVKKVVGESRDGRAEGIKYGDILQKLVARSIPGTKTQTPTPSDFKRPRTIFDIMDRERSKNFDDHKHRNALGNEYMKQAKEQSKEFKRSSHHLQHVDTALDQVLSEVEKKKENDIKVQLKKNYKVQDIFKRDKSADDKQNNYAKLNTLRKIDKFESSATQALAVKTLKNIDTNIKEREKKIKDGTERDQGLDREYIKSIQTKIDVLNHKFSGADNTRRSQFQEKLVKEQKKKLRVMEASAVKKRAQSALPNARDSSNPFRSKSPLPKRAELEAKDKYTPRKSPAPRLENPAQVSLNHKARLPKKTDNLQQNKKPKEVPKYDSSLNSVDDVEKFKPLLNDDQMNHKLIKELSRDLDQDPSASINLSHQKFQQKELEGFYEKKGGDAEDYNEPQPSLKSNKQFKKKNDSGNEEESIPSQVDPENDKGKKFEDEKYFDQPDPNDDPQGSGKGSKQQQVYEQEADEEGYFNDPDPNGDPFGDTQHNQKGATQEVDDQNEF